jgi:hypothetical protein
MSLVKDRLIDRQTSFYWSVFRTIEANGYDQMYLTSNPACKYKYPLLILGDRSHNKQKLAERTLREYSAS